MGSEWPETFLEELADEVTVGFVGSMASEYVDDGIPFFRSKNITPYRINWDDVKYITREFHQKIRKSYLRPGDVVIVRTGKPGTASIVPESIKEANCSDLVIVRPGPELDKRFLVYFLNSAAEHHINAHLVGAVQQHFNVGSAKKLSIPLPPLTEQKAIAHILGSLDDKIELNRRMNATLEQMAQALFKSWFVDFDPVIDNALAAGNSIPEELAERAQVRSQALANGTANRQAAKHFPDAFQLTEEMGWIPEGWEISPMPEVTTFREGPGVLAKDFHEQGVPLIRLAGLKSGVSLLDGCNFLDPDKVEKKWSHFRLLRGDILLSSSASLGRVAEVDDEAVGAIPYTGIIGFRSVEEKTLQQYIHHYLTSSHFQDQVAMVGAGSVLNHFGPTHLKKMYMLVPALTIQRAFSDVVDPTRKAQYRRLKESDTLAKLRDTLLPRLISGEVRIPEAEEKVQA